MKNPPRIIFLLFLSLLSVAAFAFVVIVTRPWGIAITPDSTWYTQIALSLSRGDGFLMIGHGGVWRPVDYVALLYPIVLSPAPFFGLDISTWATRLNAFCFAVTVFLSGMFVLSASGRSALAVAGALLVMVTPDVAGYQLGLWTESLFLMLTLLCLGSMVLSENRGRVFRPEFLYVATILAGLAALARHTGPTLIVCGTIFYAVFSTGARSERIRRAAFFGTVSAILPALVYGTRTVLFGKGGILKRGLYLPSPDKLECFARTLSGWFLPDQMMLALRFGLTLLLGAVVVRLVLRDRAAGRDFGEGRSVVRVLALFVAVYIGMLAATSLFVAPDIYLDDRFLMPPLAVLCVLLPIVLVRPGTGLSRNGIGVALLSLLILVGIVRTFGLAQKRMAEGFCYSSKVLQTSRLVRDLRSLPDDLVIYTNDQRGFYALTGRPSIEVPPLNRSMWRFDLGRAERELAARKAFFVALRSDVAGPIHPAWQAVFDRVGVEELEHDAAGSIWGCRR